VWMISAACGGYPLLIPEPDRQPFKPTESLGRGCFDVVSVPAILVYTPEGVGIFRRPRMRGVNPKCPKTAGSRLVSTFHSIYVYLLITLSIDPLVGVPERVVPIESRDGDIRLKPLVASVSPLTNIKFKPLGYVRVNGQSPVGDTLDYGFDLFPPPLKVCRAPSDSARGQLVPRISWLDDSLYKTD
jgi:hypothetical protein